MNFFIIWLLHHLFMMGVLLLRRSKQLHAFTRDGSYTVLYKILKPVALFLAASTLIYFFLFKLLLGWHFHTWLAEGWYVLIAFTTCDILAFAMVYNTNNTSLTPADRLIIRFRRRYITIRFLFFCSFYLRIILSIIGVAIILGFGLMFILFPYERGKDTQLIDNYYLDYSGYGLENRTYITKRLGPFSKDLQRFADGFERKSAIDKEPGDNEYPEPFPYRMEHGKDTVYIYAPNSVAEYENYVAVRAQPREYIKAYRNKAAHNIIVEYWMSSELQQKTILPD